MRSHNIPWPWQGKFPANEEYAKDIDCDYDHEDWGGERGRWGP